MYHLLVLLALTSVSFQLLGEAIWTAYQPTFSHDGLAVTQIGVLFSVMAIVSAVGALATRFLMRRWGVYLIEVVAALLICLTAALLCTSSAMIHVVATLPAALAFGVSMTPIIATVQQFVDQKFHSTALSMVSVAQYLSYGVASLYISVFIDHLGIVGAHKVLCYEAIIVALFVGGLYLANRQHDTVITSLQ